MSEHEELLCNNEKTNNTFDVDGNHNGIRII